jgi:hypothetical protein
VSDMTLRGTHPHRTRLRRIDRAQLEAHIEDCQQEISIINDRIQEHIRTINLDPKAYGKIRRLQIAREVLMGELRNMQEVLDNY